MIECYFSNCEYHDLLEPLCVLENCLATENELKEYMKHRRFELEISNESSETST